MKRTERFPDTKTYHYHNANPANRLTSDCVARAISTASGMHYTKVVQMLTDLQIYTGYDTSDPHCYGKFLESEGWIKHRQPRKANGRKFTGREFCEQLALHSDHREIIAHLGGHHIVAIIDGRVWDTWDSTDGCVGNYWTK